MLDGNRDYLTFEDTGFTRGEYTIGFWFSRRTECHQPGRWEVLYSVAEDPDIAFWRDNSASAVEIYLSCNQDPPPPPPSRWDRGPRNTDEAEGDILRTHLQDDCGNVVRFDIAMTDTGSTGVVTTQWVHYLVSVGRDGVTVYIDGEPVAPGA